MYPIQSNPIQSNSIPIPIPIQSKKIEFLKVRRIILSLMLSFFSLNAFAQINYSTLYDNTTFNNAINLSLPVGSVGGSDATSSSGSAAYSIPITIPVGTNGIVPQLSLQYSSSGNNNSLGWGGH
jgi:hypothetical protein